jgi:D-beta-D-heptose 7-phosphate kinase/D-beta-D-heptose 1-phosphate adenosyltransferase
MLPDLHILLGLLEGGFRDVRILVIGDVMLDRYIQGEVDRISPEAPVPVLRHAQRYDRAGGAANVALNLAGLGCQTFLAGLWGDDAEQKQLASLLEAAHVDTLGMVSSSLPTASKTRIIGRRQQLLRLDIESSDPIPAVELDRLEQRTIELTAKVHAVILSDYAKGALTPELCAAVIRAARQHGIPILADPKTPDFSKYTGATTVCPNLAELALATRLPAADTPALLAAGQALVREHDLQFLTVTRSEKGIAILRAPAAPDPAVPGQTSSAIEEHPARAREVFDVSGAGDTVIATLAACLAAALPVSTSVELANLAASVVVGKMGTVPVSAAELVALLTPSSGVVSAEKILSLEGARARVAEWRATGETIVFTNGCFDLLHVGHITLLEDCHRFGSKLILGLNADASVGRLKGPSRPIVGERERARVMAALAAVDAVVLFEEDTPLDLIQTLRPDVLVKGGDYTIDTVIGHELVQANGGRVEIIPTIEGFSTTNIVKKLSVAPALGDRL